jgi:hypothetical protein
VNPYVIGFVEFMDVLRYSSSLSLSLSFSPRDGASMLVPPTYSLRLFIRQTWWGARYSQMIAKTSLVQFALPIFDILSPQASYSRYELHHNLLRNDHSH